MESQASSGITVATPERVALDLPVAGIGHRALAWLADAGVMFVALLLVYFVYSLVGRSVLEVAQDLSGAGRAVALLAGFAILQGYWSGFEIAWRGQTPGKRLLRIRVVRRDGAPASAFELVTRNLLRAIDFLPMCYPAGVVTMLVDRHHRRLGDLVAGTVLVREERIALSRYTDAAASTLPVAQFETVTALLARWDMLEPEARLRVASGVLTGLGQPTPGDEASARASLERLLRRDG
ncbi:MAG: RDD family protein [Myxococcaceae bacterium]|nr:RDD family protein [Myxococcaceae bacterium]